METLCDHVVDDLLLPPLTKPEAGGTEDCVPVRVEFRVTFLHIGVVNTVNGYVNMKVFVHYYWRDPRVKDLKDPNWKKIWYPKPTISNSADKLNVVENPPALVRADDDLLRGEFIAEGEILNPIDLRNFPFDYDDVQLNIDTFQFAQDVNELSMHPMELYASDDTFYSSLGFANWFDPRTVMTEWVMMNLEMMRKELEYDMTVPQIQVQFYILRHASYYITKIVTLLLGASVLSYSAAFMDIFDDYTDRMNFIATMFLATSALLYVVASDLPKVPYLTILDRVTMTTFLFIFMLGIESFTLRIISLIGEMNQDDVSRWDKMIVGMLCGSFTLAILLLVIIPWSVHRKKMARAPRTKQDIILGDGGVIDTVIETVVLNSDQQL